MKMELPEALAVVLARHLAVDIWEEIEANWPPEDLYKAALAVVSKEAYRVQDFNKKFGDMSGDNS